MGLSIVQIKEGLRNIKKLPEHLERRKFNAKKYTEYLLGCNKNHVPFSLFENHSFLKYPLLVNEKEEVIRKAKSHNIELGEWLNSPIHPIQNNFDFWKMSTKLYPLATFASKHMVNIPVETNHAERIIEFLKTIDNHILDAIK
jgi:dTDP-4-amino-4,6-dideoxygalactose transaminase